MWYWERVRAEDGSIPQAQSVRGGSRPGPWKFSDAFGYHRTLRWPFSSPGFVCVMWLRAQFRSSTAMLGKAWFQLCSAASARGFCFGVTTT